jgi:hypothetical protein
MSCDEAGTIAHLFVVSAYALSAQNNPGGSYTFWYGYRKPSWLGGRPASHRRYWTCRPNRSNTQVSCRALGVSFHFWNGTSTAPDCNSVYATLQDPVDSFSTDAGDWLQSGSFVCAGLQDRVRSFYQSGLNARNGARRHYNQYGGWTCTALSTPSPHQGYSAANLFTCVGEDFPRSTLPQEIVFDLQPSAVAVTCAGVLCNETYPTQNGDYGDVNGYTSAGLVKQTDATGGSGLS